MFDSCIAILLVVIATLAYCVHVMFKLRRAQKEVLFLHILRHKYDTDDAPWVSTSMLFDDLEQFMSLGQLHILINELQGAGWVAIEDRWVGSRPRRFVRAIRKPA